MLATSLSISLAALAIPFALFAVSFAAVTNSSVVDLRAVYFLLIGASFLLLSGISDSNSLNSPSNSF